MKRKKFKKKKKSHPGSSHDLQELLADTVLVLLHESTDCVGHVGSEVLDQESRAADLRELQMRVAFQLRAGRDLSEPPFV